MNGHQFPTGTQIVVAAALGMICVQVLSAAAGATALAAALRGITALIVIAAFGWVARSLLAAGAGLKPLENRSVGLHLDLVAGADEDGAERQPGV